MNRRWALKRPDQPVTTIICPEHDLLDNVQEIVGGFVEAVSLSEQCVVLCDEEGISKHLPANCGFLGNLLFVGNTEDWASLTDEEVEKVKAWCDKHAKDVHPGDGFSLHQLDATHLEQMQQQRQHLQDEWDNL